MFVIGNCPHCQKSIVSNVTVHGKETINFNSIEHVKEFTLDHLELEVIEKYDKFLDDIVNLITPFITEETTDDELFDMLNGPVGISTCCLYTIFKDVKKMLPVRITH